MDVDVNILVTSISYTTWLRTSLIANGLKDDKGNSLISLIEIGPDQEDAFLDFMGQATREVLKSFVSRQGDAIGVPFEYNGTNVIYRFAEGEPVLPQAAALKSILSEDVKNALFAYVTALWFGLKGNEKYVPLFMTTFNDLVLSIQGNLYRLHD